MAIKSFNPKCFIIKEDPLFNSYNEFLKLLKLLKIHSDECGINSFSILLGNLVSEVENFHPCYIVGNFGEYLLKQKLEKAAIHQNENVSKYFTQKDQVKIRQWFSDLKESEVLKKMKRSALRFHKLAKENPPNVYQSTLVFLANVVKIISDCANKISGVK